MTSWRRLQTRIRELDPWRLDIAITALFIAAWLVEDIVIQDFSGEDKLVTGVFGVLALAPLAVRRRRPIVPPLALAVVSIVSETFSSSFLVDESTAPFVAFIFELYSVGRYVEGRRMVLGGIGSIVGLYVALTIASGPTPEDIIWVGFILGAPLLPGRAVRNRLTPNTELGGEAQAGE